jgi:hypothetical protein
VNSWFDAGLLLVLVALAAFLKAAIAQRRNAERERDDALRHIETQRKISDATRDPVSVDAARGWLRDFGAPRDPGQR